jgi:hypothetical protein
MGVDSGLKAGSTIRIQLPSASLCDLRTFKLHFLGTTFSASPNNNGIVFFPQISAVLDQISVSINGVNVETTPFGYNALVRQIENFTVGREARDSRRLLYNESFPGLSELTKDFYTIGPTATDSITVRAELAPGMRQTAQPFVIDSFPGCFLGTVEPRILPTALLGDVVLSFTLAPNSILLSTKLVGVTKAADATPTPGEAEMDTGGTSVNTDGALSDTTPVSPGYQLDSLYATVKTIDLRLELLL